MVAEPAAIPDTTPVELTVAMFALLVDHVNVRPEITFPPASFAVACSATVAPTPIAGAGGSTDTVATVCGVLTLARLETSPNTALPVSVPRNATT
jgi:hypothetical protein